MQENQNQRRKTIIDAKIMCPDMLGDRYREDWRDWSDNAKD